ncbi:hypothetical protein D3C84_1023730 [compost metagenome]
MGDTMVYGMATASLARRYIVLWFRSVFEEQRAGKANPGNNCCIRGPEVELNRKFSELSGHLYRCVKRIHLLFRRNMPEHPRDQAKQCGYGRKAAFKGKADSF